MDNPGKGELLIAAIEQAWGKVCEYREEVDHDRAKAALIEAARWVAKANVLVMKESK